MYSDHLISGAKLKDMLLAAASFLEVNQQTINDLNVFPVPDGDTGTNLVLTMTGAAARLAALPENSALGQVATEAARGALLSARGNSGVILSQFMRGLARGLSEKAAVSPRELAKAFQYGLVYAYQAVTVPVEGTILTVARELARGSRSKVRESEDLEEILNEALVHGQRALAYTPNQLQVLREAGVVDAGGQGLLVFLEGCLAGLRGEVDRLILPVPTAPPNLTPATVPGPLQQVFPLEFTYCTETLVRCAAVPSLQELRLGLSPLGDSLLLVDDEDIIKCHLHTNNPGQVLELLLQYGSLHDIKIDNMADQHRDTTQAVPRPLAVVAISPGIGLSRIFLNLGVVSIVAGGDTMNPSVEEIRQAITATGAARVLVLANNSNIRLAAQQAAADSGAEVKVIPTEDPVQGLKAMLGYNNAKSLEDNYESMLANAQEVRSGRITYAVRRTKWRGRLVEEGAVLGLSQGELLVVAEDLETASRELVGCIVDQDAELLTLFCGQGVSPAEAEKVKAALAEAYPALEIELQEGGQPQDYFWVMLE